VELGREALARAPDSDYVHYRLAAYLRRSGDLTGARRHAEAAIERDPRYAPYWTELGWIERQSGSGDEVARRCADRALEIRPEDVYALYLRAFTLPEDTAAQRRDALTAYKRVLEVDPEFDAAWGAKARLHLAAAELDEAEEAARTALSLDPEDDAFRGTLYDVLKRRSIVYRVLRWPGDVVGKGFGLIDRLPWWLWILLCVVGIGSRFFLLLLAAGLVWLVFVYPVLKLYEWLSTSDVRRRAREVAPRGGRMSLHRWPRFARAGLVLAGAGLLWYGAWRFFGSEQGRSTFAVVVAVAFGLAVLFGFGALLWDALRRRGRRRRRERLEAMMETK
jgi:hypothetical protein